MSRSPMHMLIAKDLYLYRWLILGTLLAGMAAIPLLGLDGSAGLVGQILFLTVLIVHAVILSVHGPLSERHHHSQVLVMSLPVSPLQVAMARIVGGLVGYGIPWASLFLLLVTLQVAGGDVSRLPFTVGMMLLLLMNFCLLLAFAMIGRNEVWCVAGIIATNTSVPVILGGLLPTLIQSSDGASHWTSAFLLSLAFAGVAMALSLGSILLVNIRRWDRA